MEGGYSLHKMFFEQAKRVKKVECGKNRRTHQLPYHILYYENLKTHIKVESFRLEWYKKLKIN